MKIADRLKLLFAISVVALVSGFFTALAVLAAFHVLASRASDGSLTSVLAGLAVFFAIMGSVAIVIRVLKK